MRLKNDASTETRLTSRRTAAASRTTSWPNTRALPWSCSSSVERIRTRVLFPDPFCPSTATHSPRATLNVTPVSALACARRRRLNCLWRSKTSTANIAGSSE
jgi:hypothetical protein